MIGADRYGGNTMTKQEFITKMVQSLLSEELLNVADASNVEALTTDVTAIISRQLEDFTLMYSNGILPE